MNFEEEEERTSEVDRHRSRDFRPSRAETPGDKCLPALQRCEGKDTDIHEGV